MYGKKDSAIMMAMESILMFVVGYDFVTGNLTGTWFNHSVLMIYLGDIFVLMV